MNDLATKISSLSPEQRELFELRLRNKAARSAKLQPIAPRGTTGPCPLSYEQERLWLVQQVFPDGAAYNISNAFRLAMRLDLRALWRSLAEILKRHEILRTCFVEVDAQPVQICMPAGLPELTIVDLLALPAATRRTETQRVIFQRHQQPFDLAAGRQVRSILLRLDSEEHVLVVTMHHIVTDWWSFDLFRRELTTLYADFASGREPSLPPLPIQFADFACWQRSWLQDEVMAHHLAYWQEQLRGAPEELELPLDHPRPAANTFRGARQAVELGTEVTPRLRTLCRREQVNSFVAHLAAFVALLARFAEQDDLLVGTPVADRGRPETENLIGYFLNTLVLRFVLSGGMTFRELIAQVRQVLHAAYDHQDLPLGKLLDALKPARNASRMPLYQVAFVYVPAPDPTASGPLRGNLTSVEMAPGTSRMDLALLVDDKPLEAQCTFEYSAEIFDRVTIGRLAAQFAVLLAAAVSEPERRVAELPLLTAAERLQSLVEWNDTALPEPGGIPLQGRLIHGWFEAEAGRDAAALAVLDQDRQLTYGELDRLANRLAHELRRRGVGPDALVGLCAERSCELIVGLLGILKAGAAYLPLDPAHPARRSGFLLADAGVSVVVAEERLGPHFAGLPILPLEAVFSAGGAESGPVTSVAPDHLAYVIYTSGSTGTPKGVMVTHRSLAASTAARLAFYGRVERFLLLSPVIFDSSVAGIFGTLCQGGALLLPRSSAERDPRQVVALAAEHGATHLLALPGLYSLLLEEEGGRPLSGLHTAIVAGEPCPAELVERHRRLLPQTALCNEYGPTEGTVWSSVYDTAAPWPGERVPVGRPIHGARLYVLSRSREPTPGVGELWIGGVGIARGYLRHPELTAERFVPDPFADQPGARLYRTGDLARWLPDGNLSLLGRADRQVKVRGVRVELGEVEAALTRSLGVRDVAVVLREDTPGQPRLVAYVAAVDSPPTFEELRRGLRQELPGALVPTALVVLPALPRTASGKLDRRALPAPGTARPALEAAYLPPRNELERLLATAWHEVLGLEEVGIDDNFFDSGGHSLLMPRLRQRLQEVARVELSLADVFRHPTVRSLAEHLGQDSAASAPPRPDPEEANARRQRQDHLRTRRLNVRSGGRAPGLGG